MTISYALVALGAFVLACAITYGIGRLVGPNHKAVMGAFKGAFGLVFFFLTTVLAISIFSLLTHLFKI